MKAKKLFSALLAAVMAFSLLCAPAFAAGKADTLTAINKNDSIWVSVANLESLRRDVTISQRIWKFNSDGSMALGDTEKQNMFYYELPLGVTLAVGPYNNCVDDIRVYSDPDGDGIYVQRLSKANLDEDGYIVDTELLPTNSTGPFTDTNQVNYYYSYRWSYGNNHLDWSDAPGYRTLTTDYLVEEFGANSLVLIHDNDGYFHAFLLTGKAAPAGVLYPLAAQGVYFSNFGDVVSGWAVEPVNAAGEVGLIRSALEKSHNFDLTGYITRAEFARVSVDLYYAMSGEESVENLSNPFTDLDEDSEFYTGILAAYKLGVVKGTSTEKMTFEPNKLVSRQELALMLSRVFEALGGKIPAGTSTTFADNGEIGSWAMDAVAFMSAKGIINGVGSNRFDPKGNASVEQALKIAVEMLNRLDV